MPLTVAEFVHRWKLFAQTEKAGSQSQFNELCEILGEPTPVQADPAGEKYAFEKHVGKTRGGKGFADVWFRGHFAWEYKGLHKDLKKAYDQLNDYREELGNPPLLVVSDMETCTCSVDTTSAVELPENEALCFRTDEKGGPFEIGPDAAKKMLSAPLNVNGRPNSDVIRRWVNATDITGRDRGLWIIDFHGFSEQEAAQYELPFETLRRQIAQERELAGEADRIAKPRVRWWLHRRPGSEMRQAIRGLNRYIATIATGKYRLFVWLDDSVLPDHQLYVVARQDEYFFGALHSIVHEHWSREKGTQTRDAESGCRYTPTSTFQTFPFPWPPGHEPSESDDPRVKAIADAARELVRLRDHWLNPPDIDPKELPKRTLTNLYNQRPAWLANVHDTLDRAVFAAYGWPWPLTRDEILSRLLKLNHERSQRS